MTENLWDTAKAVLRGTFIAIQSHLKKQEYQKKTKQNKSISNKQSNTSPKETRERSKKTQSQ